MSAILGVFNSAKEQFESIVEDAGLTLFLWLYAEVAISAKARHPSGGLASIEWTYSHHSSLHRIHVLHSEDQPDQGVGRSWKTEAWAGHLSENENMLPHIKDAIESLLADRSADDYETWTIRKEDYLWLDEYVASFGLLRSVS